MGRRRQRSQRNQRPAQRENVSKEKGHVTTTTTTTTVSATTTTVSTTAAAAAEPLIFDAELRSGVVQLKLELRRLRQPRPGLQSVRASTEEGRPKL